MPGALLASLLEQEAFSRTTRLPSLYSDFSPLAQSNRDGYDANVNAWLAGLNRAIYASGEGRLTITADTKLAESLTSSKWGRPLALYTVEAEARKKGAWIPLDVFESQPESIYTPTISSFSLMSMLSWGLSKLFTSSKQSALSGTPYVIVANLERLADTIQSGMSNGTAYTDSCTTTDLLASWCRTTLDITLSATDLRILLIFLRRDRRSVCVRDDTIKFCSARDDRQQEAEEEQSRVSDSDVACAQLKRTIANVSARVEALSRAEETLSATLATQVTESRKVLAMSTLRRRKLVQRDLNGALDQRHECEMLLASIDTGMTQVSVVNGLEAGSRALGQVLSKIGGVERVEEVIDRVKEQSEQVHEVGAAIAWAGNQGAEDEDDVEDEYQALLIAQNPALPKTAAPEVQPEATSQSEDAERKQQQSERQGEKREERVREAVLA